jgi:hypothetical protein
VVTTPDTEVKVTFTPKPWRIAGAVGHGILILSRDKQIAVVHGTSANKSGPSNAHLIAAAPEMYDALKSFTEAAESWHATHHGQSIVQCDLICESIPAARAALAKATRLHNAEATNG